MTTPNLVRREKLLKVVEAFKRMQTVDEAAIALSEKLRTKREEKERVLAIQDGRE